jgi:hypothetical protein
MKNDVLFLESCSIIDYSLLIGIHSKKYGDIIEKQLNSIDNKEVYFIGIIDILTGFK